MGPSFLVELLMNEIFLAEARRKEEINKN